MEQAPAPQEKFNVDEVRMLAGIALKRLGAYQYADKIGQFAAHLQETYPDYQRRRAFHALAGSTVSPERDASMIEEDFPGDDSVLKFIHSLAMPE